MPNGMDVQCCRSNSIKKKPCRFKEEKELVMEDRRVKLSFQHVRTSLEMVVSCSSTSILLVAAPVRDQLLMQLSSVELCKVIETAKI